MHNVIGKVQRLGIKTSITLQPRDHEEDKPVFLHWQYKKEIGFLLLCSGSHKVLNPLSIPIADHAQLTPLIDLWRQCGQMWV